MFTHKDLIYHRGRHGYVEQKGHFVLLGENSLESFKASIKEGARMIEFDARKNPAGGLSFPIIAHDPCAGSGVPTIVDALDAIAGKASVNIEIKDPEIWERTLEILRWYITHGKYKAEQFVISSFHHATVVAIKKRSKHLTVGAIMDGVPLPHYVSVLARAGIDNLHMEYMNADMDMQSGSAFMTRAKEHGMHVWVWTVNDIATAKRVYDWGGERIFTDKPFLFQK